MSQARDPLFRAWALLCAAAAFLLLAAGGMVTSTGSGLSVPDWPLSFGGFFPRMIGGVFFEHGHRLIAGLVASLALALAALASRPAVPGPARVSALLALAAILLQALLGGLTVLLRLPPAVSISHAALGQGVFCLLVAAAELSSERQTSMGARAASRLAWIGFAAAYLQLFLGALIRHTGSGAVLHVAWACVAAVLVLAPAIAANRAGLRGLGFLLAALLVLQLGLGVFAYRLRFDPSLVIGFHEAALWRTAHLLGGAAILATLLVLGLRTREAR